MSKTRVQFHALFFALACCTFPACADPPAATPAADIQPDAAASGDGDGDAIVCHMTIDGNTDCKGGECHGELLCCDKASGGCFCADTEHGAVCPSGSVKAPEMD